MTQMIKSVNKDKFQAVDQMYVQCKKNMRSAKCDVTEFFIKYMLENRVLANYIWEPILPDASSEFDYPIMGIQTIGNKAPYELIKELERSFLSIAEMFDLSYDFYFTENNNTSFSRKFRLTCNDTNITISSLEMQTDKAICPGLKKFIDKQKLSVNCDFVRQKGNYFYTLEKAIEK